MPRNRKYFQNKTVLLVTSRIEEGLPLVPSHFLNEIIWGILARGRKLFKVRICHFVFMSNHFHMLLVVEDPEGVSKFIGYVKAEIAHAVNRLLGRRQKTIWCKGYDSPVLLTSNDVLRYIDYIYANPIKANLVSKISHYPGVSSWEMFDKGVTKRECKHLSRDSIPILPFASMSINEQKRLLERLLSSKVRGSEEEFILEPFAWMECFSDCRKVSEDKMRDVIKASVQKTEGGFERQRSKNSREVIGATALRRESMLKAYTPEKYSRRMICISSDIDLRKRFIEHFKSLCSYARKVFEAWRCGVSELRIPAGLLAPRVPVLVSSLTRFT